MAEISPWLTEERRRWAEGGESLEGAGCWSPLFPARLDELWLAAVATVKRIEAALVHRSFNGELEVLEVQYDNGHFRGLKCLDGTHEG